ncbi:MAG: hypothetical protein JSW34_05550, partial [Candidatus Zixiibacteriota bacterium]
MKTRVFTKKKLLDLALDVLKSVIPPIVVSLLLAIAGWVIGPAGAKRISGALLGAFGRLPNFFSDLGNAEPSVHLVFVLMLVALATCILLLIKWARRGLRGCPLYSTTDKNCELGIAELRDRETTPVCKVISSANASYSWTGLSANNELSPTESFDRLKKAANEGVKINYLIMNPKDVLRVREHAHWESTPTETRNPEQLVSNINNSFEQAKALADTGNCQVRTAARLPCLRVTIIDESEFHVAHYDKGGCGYYGDLLVLRGSSDSQPTDDTKRQPMLVEWFRHFADIERKNTIIDDFYAAIAREYGSGASESEVVS